MRSLSLLWLLLSAATLPASDVDLRPFPMDSNGLSGGEADVSFLLQAPAGKDGFIGIRNGHLATPGGKRFRIWGINVAGGACTPSKEAGRLVAAQFARFGLNCVRFHRLDTTSGLIDAKRKDTRALDPAQLDRFDYFVAELKNRGIYVDLNLNVGRRYKPGDGVRDSELIGLAKALTLFDDRLITLEREFARQLLTHYNPYTKSEYRNEPAVLMIEMVNENSITESWVKKRLLGKSTRKNPGTWTDIPASYEKDLSARYNAWLARKLKVRELQQLRTEAGVGEGTPIPRLKPAEFGAASAFRFETEAAFYADLENTFFQSMRSYLKDELGVKALLTGTRGNTVYSLLRSVSKLDIVDGHTYWQHPRYVEDPSTGRRTGFAITNTPMVNDPLHSSIIALSKAAVAGKPFTVSEVNHPFPSEYACEGFPILAAYGSLQDWDGIFGFAYNSDPADWKGYEANYFDLRPDPVKMTQMAAGALAFLRGDISPARETVSRSYSTAQVYESLRLPASEEPYYTPGFPLTVPLVHAARIASLDGPGTSSFQSLDSDPILSDTKQLGWYGAREKKGLVTVETERTQALIGFVKDQGKQLQNLSASVTNPFCAIVLTSLDGKALSQSAKMLLTAGARVANTGMTWNEKRKSLTNWGGAPTLIEVVTGAITLHNLQGATKVEADALDTAGKAIKTVSGRETAAGWEIPIGGPTTTWYAVRVQH